MQFSIDYHRDCSNLPRIFVTATPQEHKDIFDKDFQLTFFQKIHGYTLRLACNQHPYYQFECIGSDGKWWASRASCFNNTAIHLVEVIINNRCGIAIDVEEVTKLTNGRIKFFEVDMDGEVEYIPYEQEHKGYIREKLGWNKNYTILNDDESDCGCL